MKTLKTYAAAAVAMVALSACATKGYVRNQVSTGLATERTAREAADSSITNTMNSEFSGVKSEIATLKTDVAALRSDLTALRTEFGAKITAMENGMKFAFPVNFVFDDATVRDEDRPALDKFVQVVNKHYGGSLVTIEGFADPAGSPRYNKDLSQRRAESVASYLATAGIQGVTLRSVGLGETRLVVDGAERDMPGAEANRRVVFVVETKGATATAVSSNQ
jgi:outer membrane protein OmpA-like peptidoglycan-associated protein